MQLWCCMIHVMVTELHDIILNFVMVSVTSSLKAPPHLYTFAFHLATFGLQRRTRRDR